MGAPGLQAQSQVDEDRLGGWLMYFYNHQFSDGPWGVQGDFQLRNHNVGNDLEQLLLRSGVTYSPENADVTFTLGYANITTGTPGESDETSGENRIYQEVLLPHRVGSRFYLTHRFRYEQRFVEDQDFRTRYRYNLFINVPLNQTDLSRGAVYLALYNELFINGQLDIGDGRQVQYFDRNRSYLALGYSIRDNLRTQVGYMQQTTVNWAKGQLQLSVHHSW
jgi:hypothetical protein